MDITGAQLITSFLERRDTAFVAGIPGGAVLPLYRALADSSLKHVLARNEQGAAFIAQGYARVSGRAGVCIATSGPGVTNTVTALADAKADSVPLVCLAGQVSRALKGTDAFQEAPTGFIVDRITKAHFEIGSAAELAELLPEAFRIAESGRPGPVLLDIPKDVQTEYVSLDDVPQALAPGYAPKPNLDALARAVAMIERAQRPVLYLGGGVRIARAFPDAHRLAEIASLPTVTTLMALGTLPADHPLNLGMLGMHGARYANHAIDECDLLIAVGARFDDRATGKLSAFAPNARVIHIDADPRELGKLRRPDLAIHADAGAALRALCEALRPQMRTNWLARVGQLRREYPMPGTHRRPKTLIAEIARLAGRERAITTDVGQHQMWMAQHYPIARPEGWLTSGGLGTMGFGIPAAIGAALANPEHGALCVTGDGSLLMNVQELATLADLGLDVKIVVLDNGGLGMVRQQQSLFYQRQHTASAYPRGTSICALAEAFGIPAVDLGLARNPQAALRRAFAQAGPMLVRAPVDPEELVLPMVAPGKSNIEAIAEMAA
ncbi:MAG: biosynthetic-type acetolactate synthase large subunit [Panacagrimonas sp.]